MGKLEVRLPDETVSALRGERDLLGFETVEEYLAWLVANRSAIDVEGRRGRLLSKRAGNAIDQASDMESVDTPDPAGNTKTTDPERGTETGDGHPKGERVVRVEDTELTAVTDALSTVQGQQLDELARRAAVETRERLGDGAASGLGYQSWTDIGHDDRRPGEDIVDLDTIEVPGYDAELVERRREAVGAALAFLRDVEEAKRADFVAELYESYPAGYESVDGWWTCLKRGLRQVDRVDSAGEHSRTWRFLTVPGRVTRLPR